MIIRVSEYCLNFFWEVSWITLFLDCFHPFTVLGISNRGQSKRWNVYHSADDIKHFIQIPSPLPNRHYVSAVATEALGNVPTSLQATLFFLSSTKLIFNQKTCLAAFSSSSWLLYEHNLQYIIFNINNIFHCRSQQNMMPYI